MLCSVRNTKLTQDLASTQNNLITKKNLKSQKPKWEFQTKEPSNLRT